MAEFRMKNRYETGEEFYQDLKNHLIKDGYLMQRRIEMKETNVFEEMNNQEKLLTHILPTTLFCEECGITETSPSFGQQYCRYCGAKFENKSWTYEEGDEIKTNIKRDNDVWNNGHCDVCGGPWKYKHAIYDSNDAGYIYVCDRCGKTIKIDEVR